MRRPDLGMRAAAIARTFTPEQLEEMLAIQWFDLIPGRTPTPQHDPKDMDDPIIPLLLRARVLVAQPVKGWSRRTHRLLCFTPLGRLALHYRIESDLRKYGCIPPERTYGETC